MFEKKCAKLSAKNVQNLFSKMCKKKKKKEKAKKVKKVQGKIFTYEMRVRIFAQKLTKNVKTREFNQNGTKIRQKSDQNKTEISPK